MQAPRTGRLLSFVILGILVFAEAARGGLPRPTLERVGISLPANAQVPLWLPLSDEDGAPRTLAEAMRGRPSLLILADYACNDLCGPILALASASLRQSGLEPDQDYRMVAVGLRPNSEPAAVRAVKRAQIGEGDALARASSLLTADAAALEEIASSLGYRFAYDAENRQIAHPAAAFVLTGTAAMLWVRPGCWRIHALD